jgi:hypothetical protein
MEEYGEIFQKVHRLPENYGGSGGGKEGRKILLWKMPSGKFQKGGFREWGLS